MIVEISPNHTTYKRLNTVIQDTVTTGPIYVLLVCLLQALDNQRLNLLNL